MAIHKTKAEGFTIRNAEEKDITTILSFIKELAAYEKLLDEVVATEEVLKESLFQRKVAEVLIAEYQQTPVGYALFFYNFSTFLGLPGLYLEDLYIRPEMRGRGYGKMLLTFLAKLAVERKCGRLEWSCLDWNEPSIRFYKQLGAIAMEEWTVYRVHEQSLAQLAEQF